jgi:hypothetical protein
MMQAALLKANTRSYMVKWGKERKIGGVASLTAG